MRPLWSRPIGLWTQDRHPEWIDLDRLDRHEWLGSNKERPNWIGTKETSRLARGLSRITHVIVTS